MRPTSHVAAAALVICVLFTRGCTAPEEYSLDNPNDPASPNYTVRVPWLQYVLFVSDQRVRLAWSTTDKYTVEFSVERRAEDDGTFEVIATLANSTVMYEDTLGVRCNVTYYYRVRATGPSQASSLSREISIKFNFPPPGPLSFGQTSVSDIRLIWPDNSPYADGFTLEESIDGGSYLPVASVGSRVFSYVVHGLDPARTYGFRLQAHTDFNVTDYSAAVRLAHLTQGFTMLREFAAGSEAAAMSTDGAFITWPRNVYLSSHSVIAGDEVKYWYIGAQVTSFAFQPGDSVIAAGTANGLYMWKWDQAGAASGLLISSPQAVSGFSPDGHVLATTTPSGATLWSTMARSQIRTYPLGNPQAVAFSPDGRWIAIAASSAVLVYRVVDGSTIQTLSPGPSPVRSVAFSGDGACVYSGRDDGVIQKWQVSDGAQAVSWTTNGPVGKLVATPDGVNVISSGESDGSIRVWDAVTGSLKTTLSGGVGAVTSLRLEVGGHMLSSACPDGKVRIWSLGDHWWLVP